MTDINLMELVLHTVVWISDSMAIIDFLKSLLPSGL